MQHLVLNIFSKLEIFKDNFLIVFHKFFLVLDILLLNKPENVSIQVYRKNDIQSP